MSNATESRILAVLSDLISIPSPYFQEHEIVKHVYNLFRNTGIDVSLQEVTEPSLNYSCHNVIGHLNVGCSQTLLINAHLDTVFLTDDWSYDPYAATVTKDRVYGLGAADMKGGLSVAVSLMQEVMIRYKKGEKPGYNTIFLASVDEEGPFSLGVQTFIKNLGITPDKALVLESSGGMIGGASDFPTVIDGSKGSYLYEVSVNGRSAHAADPSSGEHAINAAAKIINLIDKIPLEPHSRFSSPISNVIWIEGGERALSTPAKCNMLVDFHITPMESHSELMRKMLASIDELNLGTDVRVSPMLNEVGTPMVYPPYLLEEKDFINEIVETCRRSTNSDVVVATSNCVGDFNHFNAAGIPTIVLGPGGGNLHSGDEFVLRKDLVSLYDILLNYLYISD